jgi:L-alanine-DL-glutamate epimerase-like enolase superfamily enzyme
MKINSIETNLYKIPFDKPLSDATHGLMPFFELITVRLSVDSGQEGLGYTYTCGQGGKAVYSMIRGDLESLLINSDPLRIEYLWEKMWWHIHWVGRSGVSAIAMSAVDIALWDLKAKLYEEPLWRLLGGHDQRVPIYSGGIDLQFPLEDLKKQMQDAIKRGLKAIKMKVGRPNLSEDIARVSAIREMIGPDVHLMVDANMSWSVDQAIRASRSLAEYHIYWLEEPTIPDDLPGHIRISQEGALPIAAGENLRTIYDHNNYMRENAVSFPEPDCSNLGGITPWMKVAHMAEASNLPVTSHGIHDVHVHLLAAVPNSSYLEEHGFGIEKFMAKPLTVEDGMAIAPNTPGHGVVLDKEKLRPYLVED